MLSMIKCKLATLCKKVFPEINFLISKIEDNQRVLLRMEIYNAEHWAIIDYPGVSTVDVFDLFRKTKGSKYDFIGILFSQVLQIGLHSSTKWYCSEWAAELKYVKTNLSPQELYELVSKV